jgi:hypothetical protein
VQRHHRPPYRITGIEQNNEFGGIEPVSTHCADLESESLEMRRESFEATQLKLGTSGPLGNAFKLSTPELTARHGRLLL